jgi:uncharacterized protein with NAD-binding domain and iron-sulfur cluster
MSLKSKKKIAVIGGGLSAMTAVYNLTKLPDFNEDYEITVYQLGWRIGGKGASGVNRKIGYRIEEHGLHLWMGFYENAFILMKSVYEELNRPSSHPLATFDDAFKGQSFMIFAESVLGKWIDWKIDFPNIGGIPGDGKVPTVEDLLQSGFDDVVAAFKKWINGKDKEHSINNLSPNQHHSIVPDGLLNFFKKAEESILHGTEHVIEKLLVTIGKLLVELTIWTEHHFDFHITLLHNLRKWIWDFVGKEVETNNDARRLWIGIDLFVSIVSGMLKDNVLQNRNGKLVLDFDLINDIDYIDWLIKHGADANITTCSPLVKSMYDGPFAFLKGNVNAPNVEAGTILRIFLRLAFTCKQHFVWRMQAGMGDTIFGPIYECFKKHDNIRVKFFHKAKHLCLSSDQSNVDSIEIEKQVNTIGDYDPHLEVNGLKCWPSEPIYERLSLADAEELQNQNIDLESSWTNWKAKEIITLKRGVDFDDIILGASIESVKELCPEIIKTNHAWKAMAEHIKTVQTQALQWWMNKSPEALNLVPQKLLSTYCEPLDTFSEMNRLLERENWPQNHQPKYISYVCGVLDEPIEIPPYTDTTFPAKEKMRVLSNMKDFFAQHVNHLMPETFQNDVFDWNLLIDLNEGIGEERLASQYYRANIDPSERYVLSVVGSSANRLTTSGHGVNNLYVTGDWIQNGLNAGFVEGAVVSGLLTARAISKNMSIKIVYPEWDLSYVHQNVNQI